MSEQPYVFARSCADPDQEFPSLGALAGALRDLRDEAPDRPPMRLFRAQLTRMELPGGQVLSVRLDDGRCAGRGSPLGYVFLRDYGREAQQLARLLGEQAVAA